MSTSLGVWQGSEHAEFVFGGLSDTSGFSFKFALDLHTEESLAQQQLDFIQRLYLKQARPGELFQEINIHTSALPSSSSAKPNSLIQDSRNILHELIQAWVDDQGLDIKITNHARSTILTRESFLRQHQLFPSALTLREYNLTTSFALWSMAYSANPDSFKDTSYKSFKTLEYRKIDNLNQASHLQEYKQEIMQKFNAIKFADYHSENERHYLLSMAEDAQTTRHEMLVCQEHIKKLLERSMASRNPLQENNTAANDSLTDLKVEVPAGIEKFTAQYMTALEPATVTATPVTTPRPTMAAKLERTARLARPARLAKLARPAKLGRPAMLPGRARLANVGGAAMPEIQYRDAHVIDMEMDKTAEIPAHLVNELTAEIDGNQVADLTAETTTKILPEWIEGLTDPEIESEAAQVAVAPIYSGASAQSPQPQQSKFTAAGENSKPRNRKLAGIPVSLAALMKRGNKNGEQKNQHQHSSKWSRLMDSWSVRLGVLAAVLVVVFVY